jgi:NTP pyrophosphatase (non-canonical NTP hydrolase)
VHYALSIAGEAGELANQVKKVHRGSITLDEARASIGEEAVDVLIYLLNLFAVLGVDPVDVYKEKRQKNELRFSRPGGDPRVDGARIFPDYGDPASHGYY